MTKTQERIARILLKTRSILIASHIQPDGDALGALLGMGLALEAAEKEVFMYNPGPIPKNLSFLPGIEKIHAELPEKTELPETLVFLDCGAADRVPLLMGRFSDFSHIINLDHHPSNTDFGTENLVDEKASSTTVLVYRVLREMGISIPQNAAVSLYTGIFTDTGSFRFANTNAESFAIAEDLLRLGVEPKSVAESIEAGYPFSQMKLLRKILGTLSLSPDGKMAAMELDLEMLKETGADDTESAGFINYGRNIAGVELAVLIKETAKKNAEGKTLYKVSLRGNGLVDTTLIALPHGGGGHKAASGFTTDMEPEKILPMLEKNLKEQLG